ncbi:MAG: ABC transporter ATP-binding protein, partial [Chloroflexi bacterium]
MKQLILQTSNLAIGYRDSRQLRYVAKQLNLSLYAGELVALVGPNGIGKSTLLRTLAGMQRPLDGHVELLGDVIHTLPAEERARRLSVVLTDRLDMGLMTGYDLVALGRYPYTGWAGRLMPEDEAVVRWAIHAVEAEHLAPRYLHELSDGERQKLMIARALAQEPA